MRVKSRQLVKASVVATGALLALSACGEDGPPPLERGPVETRSVEVAAFTGITASGSERIIIRHGDEQRVSVRGGRGLLDRLKIAVEDGRLVIEREREARNDNGALGNGTITITMRGLNALSLTGTGYASVDRIDDGNFDLSLTGPAEASFSYALFDRLRMTIAGPGEVSINGRATAAEIEITGPGEFKGATFGTQNADISVTGPGRAEMRVTSSARVNATGPGRVAINGTSNCAINAVGGANVRCVPD